MKHCIGIILIILTLALSACDDLNTQAAEYIANGDLIFPELVSFSVFVGTEEHKFAPDIKNKEVKGSIPYGVELTKRPVFLQSTEKARYFIDGVEIYSGDELDLTNPFVLKLKDPGGEWSDYTVSIINAPNIESQIFSFAITAAGTEYVCQVDSQTIYAYVPYGTDLKTVGIYYTVSENAEVSIADTPITTESRLDLSKDIILSVIAQDTRFKRDYRVIVKYMQNTTAELSSLIIPAGVDLYNCTFIDGLATVSVKYGTNTTNIIPKFTLSYGAKMYDASGNEIVSGETLVTFPKGETLTFYVVSENEAVTREYKVLVNELPNHEANITKFVLHVAEQPYEFLIVGNTISRSLPPNTNVVAAVVTYEASAGATVTKLAGENNSITESGYVTQWFYRVTSSDGAAVQDYIVNITVLKNDQATISNYSLTFDKGAASCVQQVDGQGNLIMTNGAYYFNCEAPFGSSLASGSVAFTLPTGATVAIKQGIDPNDLFTDISDNNPYDAEQKFNHSYDFSGLVEYKIVSENGQNIVYYVIDTYIGCGSPEIQYASGNVGSLQTSTYGRFKKEKDISLVDSCGNDLIYNYGDYLTDSSIYDSNAGGPFTNGYFRMIVTDNQTDKNVTDPSSLGLKVRAVDLSTLVAPPIDEVYIDPARGRYSLPMPLLLHTFGKVEPDINTVSGALYDFNPPDSAIAHGGFADSEIYVKVFDNPSVEFTKASYYPFQSSRVMSFDKGAMAFSLNPSSDVGLGESVDYSMSIEFEVVGAFKICRRILRYQTGEIIYKYDEYNIYVYDYAHRQYEPFGAYYNNTDATFLSLTNFYVVWDKDAALQNSKTIRVYGNGNLIMQTNAPLYPYTQNTKFVVNFQLRNWGAATETSYVRLGVSQLKLWDNVVSEDPAWVQGAAADTAVHAMYGQLNGYYPTVKAGYHTFDK